MAEPNSAAAPRVGNHPAERCQHGKPRISCGDGCRAEASAAPRVVLYAIYQSPTDHPGKVVLRRWEVRAGSVALVACDPPVAVVESVAEARNALPKGCRVQIPPSVGDVPWLVESWL